MSMKVTYEGDFCCVLRDNETGAVIHTMSAAEQGDHSGRFAPPDLIAAALATCAMTVLGYQARRLDLNLAGMTVDTVLTMTENHSDVASVELVFHMPAGTYTDKVKKQCQRAVTKCPVHAAINPSVKQIFTFDWPDEDKA